MKLIMCFYCTKGRHTLHQLHHTYYDLKRLETLDGVCDCPYCVPTHILIQLARRPESRR